MGGGAGYDGWMMAGWMDRWMDDRMIPAFSLPAFLSWLRLLPPDDSSVISQAPEQVLDGASRGRLFLMCLYAHRTPPPRTGPRAIGRHLKSRVAQMGGLAPTCPSIPGRRSCWLAGRVSVGSISQRRLDSTSTQPVGEQVSKKQLFFVNVTFPKSK